MPPKSRKQGAPLALYLVAFFLILLAGGLLALLFGRDILLGRGPGERGNRGLEDMFTMRRLEFPAMPLEHRRAFDVRVLHEDSPKEWWYLNAHLLDQYGRRYTLMMAMLKDNKLFGILSDLEDETTHTIALPDAAVSHDSKLGVFTVGPASIRQEDPAILCYNFTYAQSNMELDLEMCANKAPLAVGDDGLIIMGAGGASHYYTLTNTSIRGSGRLNDKKAEFRGRGWIDRQWGDWNDSQFDRWDWFSIQLEGDVEIVLFVFSKNGSVVRKIASVHFANGETRHGLGFQVTTTAHWKSPATEVLWDTGWVITIPEYNARLTVNADFDDHEVENVLWEGGVKVRGRWRGSPVRGRGFYEARRKAW